MTDLQLFDIAEKEVQRVQVQSLDFEKTLQNLFEKNLQTFLGVRLLASEFKTSHGGRMDTLGIDENGCPVIIEYKRTKSENVINQGLFYLDWLMDHRAEFVLMVRDILGRDVADAIDWSAPRLLCIANDFTKYDMHAVNQMPRNIELIRFAKFGDGLLLLELLTAVTAEDASTQKDDTNIGTTQYKTVTEYIGDANGDLRSLYESVRNYLLLCGDDVQERVLKFYVAFKRIQNFACVEVRPNKNVILIYLKVDPDKIELEKGFTRDVRKIGHYGTGDLEVTIRSNDDFEKAKALFEMSYSGEHV